MEVQFYILNQNTLSANVREAINLTINADEIIPYLGGTVSATSGPFSSSSAHGKVSKPDVDTTAAIALVEDDGYIHAARLGGNNGARIMLLHILPNIAGPLM